MSQSNPDKIKEAFSRVKSDILTLQSQILFLTREIQSFKRTLDQTDKPTDSQTHSNFQLNPTQNQTNPSENQTNHSFQQTNSSDKMAPEGLKPSISNISTRNEGVPTDRQTNQQTDKSVLTRTLSSTDQPINLNELTEPYQTKPLKLSEDKITQISKVSELVNSLDVLKKDIRTMFKRLTSQEMLIYSAIYQLSDQGFIVDYPLLAEKTSLSESSIRDYVLKLTKKGVPLNKSKENNKRIILSIPEDFKKVASLSTINSLREL